MTTDGILNMGRDRSVSRLCYNFSFLLFFMLIFSFFSCNQDEKLLKKRTEHANDPNADIVIGVVDTSLQSTLFTEGIDLALKEINDNGGIMGKKVKTIHYDDKGSDKEGEKVARKLAKNPEVVAVIGHRRSDVAIPVSVIYEKYGVIFITPGATHPNLTRYSTTFTFRNTPVNEDIGRQMAEFIQRFGAKKIVIFYQRDDTARRLAEIFHKEADALGIEIVATRSFFSWQDNFRNTLSMLKKNYKFDMIFLSGFLPVSATLIKQTREMEITAPFITGYALDSPQLWSIAGRAAEGTIVATLFDPNQPQKITRNFVRRFEERYSVAPDTWASQGYDAMKVLAKAMEKSGSSVPIIVSTTLKFLEDWKSVTGIYSFTYTGDITGRPIFFKQLRDGRFIFLEDKREEEKFDPFYVAEDITLRLPVEGDISTIDPGLTQDMTSIELTEQLFLGLTDFAPETYEPVPELATKWTVNEDGTVYCFQMRQDAKWTDGRTVTAHDVVWAIQRNISPETQCPYANMLYIVKNAQAIHQGEIKDVSEIGVRATDDFTVEFTLEHSASYFPGMAGLWVYRPLPRETIEKYGNQWTKPEYIQSNGSYSLTAWIKGMVMVLRRNPNYFDAKNVAIPEVHYQVIPANSLGLAMYKNNELDIMGSIFLRLPLMEVPSVKAQFKKEYSRSPQFCNYAYGFNTKRYPVDNPLVRKAISAAIDRRLLIELITQGDEETAQTYTPPHIFGSVNSKEFRDIGIKFDPVQAKKWLSQAGYKVGNEGEGKDFPGVNLMFNTSELHLKIAQAVQTSLRYYLNINVNIQEVKWDDYVRAMETNPPHMFRFGWCADYPDANNFLNEQLHPFKSANYVRWENIEFAELMDRAEESSDPEERKRLYRRAEQILTYEEAAVVPIFFETAHCLVKPRIKGWYHMAMGGQHIRNWSFKK